MADVVLTADGSQAIRTLKQVENSVTRLADRFTSLRTVLSGLALGAFTQNALAMANGLVQVSNATGIALQTVTAFSNAVAANGGTATEAAEKIGEFAVKLAEARRGSSDAQIALGKVGITLQDLATLSEQDLFERVVQGLAGIGDAATRQRTAVQLLGETFKKVDIQRVAAGMGAGISGGDAAAIQSAAAAQQNLSRQLAALQQALLNVIKPLNDIVAKIDIGTKAFERLIQAVALVGAGFLFMTKAAAPLLSMISRVAVAVFGFVTSGAMLATTGAAIAAAFGKLTAPIMAVAGMIAALGRNLMGGGTAFGLLKTALISLIPFLKTLFSALVRMAGPAGIIMGVVAAVDFLIQVFTKFSVIDWVVGKFRDLYNWVMKVKQAFTEDYPDQTENETKRLAALGKQAEQARKVVDAQRGIQLDANKVVRAYQNQNTELTRQLAFQNELIGKDEMFQQRKQRFFDLETAYLQQVRDLNTRLLELQDAARVGGDEERAQLTAFQNVYTKTLERIRKEYEGQRSEVEALTNETDTLNLREQDRVRTLERITEIYDEQRSRAEVLRDILESTSGRFVSPLLQAQRRFAETFQDSGDGMTPERARELAAGLDAIARSYEQSRSFASGWNEAFRQYIDDATNAANVARNAFGSFTDAMGRMLDNFVETGKLNFKDFARSIIADILKIQLKMAAANLFKAIGGSAAGSFIGSLFGFANGGNPPVNRPSIVGERGPELFVPKTAGTIIPNHALAGAGGGPVTNTYITNNINALDARSVAQLFSENRRTLLGATEQARKELPIRQRF